MLTPEQLAWYRANHGYDGGPMKPLCAHIDAQQARIAELEENAAAQALALKAAKAMQQAETERADANEQDAARYRWLRDEGVTRSATFYVSDEDGYAMCDSELDAAIDATMEDGKSEN